MGREIKRVPLNYEYEIGTVWPGFLNPHYKKCPDCELGVTTGRQRLEDLVSLLMLSGEDARKQTAHPYFYNAPLHYTAGRTPVSRDLAELTTALAGREPSFLGHDALDKWSAVKKIIAAAGLSEDWGICKTCEGDCINPEVKAAYEAWEQTDVPEGPGYQLWSNTTEGHPMTPVFETPGELARYCADNHISSSGYSTCTYEQWLKFIIGPGWAMDAVLVNDEIKSGVEAVIDE